jgi:mannitol-1-/sugar-/sorbitol-6-phosphatase
MPIFNCAAILFDLDGVLVDSTRSVDRQWRAWAQQKGVDGDKVMAIAHGVRTIEVIRAVAPHLDADAEVWELENREADDQEGVDIMPGAIELVRSIPEGRWGVVTSGTRLLASARLRFGGLPVPKILVTAEDVTNGKPHPEPYLKGAERMGVNPSDCLVIEDAPAGIQSAHAGGMKVVGITSTYAAAKLKEADFVVQRLLQIQVAVNGTGVLEIRAG